MADSNRIRIERKKAGFTLEDLAAEIGISAGYLSRIEAGKRRVDLEILAKIASVLGVRPGDLVEEDGSSTVPLMGFIGAGAEILPDFEQVPPEGLEQIELPMAVPDGLIALQVKGDSMMPRYDPGDVLLVFVEQRRPTISMLGEDVAVKTEDGKRFLKRLMRGHRQNSFNLESFNARTIENVRLAWIGEVYLTLRAGQLRRIEHRERAAATRARRIHEAETAGMDPLPLEPKIA